MHAYIYIYIYIYIYVYRSVSLSLYIYIYTYKYHILSLRLAGALGQRRGQRRQAAGELRLGPAVRDALRKVSL